MMPATADAILAVLGRHPDGITAKLTAAELGWKETAASLRLGRLAISGRIARTSPPGRPNNLFLYHAKPAAPAAPPQPWAPAKTITAAKEFA